MVKSKNGITLIALVITIIVLLILAGISISLLSGENGILARAKDAKEKYEDAAEKEEADLARIADEINMYNGGGLNPETVSKINEKIAESLVEVDYTPAQTLVSINVDEEYNGGQASVVFTQSNLIGSGTDKMKWFLLSASESEVKLVSTVSKEKIVFKDSSGYDNCLYYLNEIATKLFKNDEKGITINNVHMLRLTDIKEAAERINGSTYNWDTDFVANFSDNTDEEFTYTYDANDIKTYYPAIYKPNASSIVETNNPFYDEEPGRLISDAGIARNVTGNPATTLKVKHTYINSSNAAATLSHLGAFGNTPVGRELFKQNGDPYWLASRSVNPLTNFAAFSLRFVENGAIGSSSQCRSHADNGNPDLRGFRVVISVPASSVNVADDGTVTFIN